MTSNRAGLDGMVAGQLSVKSKQTESPHEVKGGCVLGNPRVGLLSVISPPLETGSRFIITGAEAECVSLATQGTSHLL